MATQNTTGHIKSYSFKNGYGFITDVVNYDSDVFFGKEMLPNEWKAAHQELIGREIAFELSTNADGKPQAREIQPTGPPEFGQRTIGTVKSWNFEKGYGFMKVLGMETDVWFARDRLPSDALGVQRLDGTSFSFKISETQDGKAQAEQMQMAGCSGGSMGMQPMQPQRQMGNMGGMRPGMKRPMQGGEVGMAKRFQKASEDQRYVGRVKSYNANNPKGGYGFIVCDSIPEDLVTYSRDLDDSIGELTTGQVVSFLVRYGNQGKAQAYDVSVSGPGNSNSSVEAQKAKDYPALTVDELKLYTKQLSAKDMGDLAAYATAVLQEKLRDS